MTIWATCRTERSHMVKYDSASSEGTRQWQDGRVNEALSKLTYLDLESELLAQPPPHEDPCFVAMVNAGTR